MMMNNFDHFYMELFKLLFISLQQHQIDAKRLHWRAHLNTQRDRFQLRALFSFNLINQLKFNSNAFKHYYEYGGTEHKKHDANIWTRRGVYFNQKLNNRNPNAVCHTCRYKQPAVWMTGPTPSELNMAKYFWNFLNSEYRYVFYALTVGCFCILNHSKIFTIWIRGKWIMTIYSITNHNENMLIKRHKRTNNEHKWTMNDNPNTKFISLNPLNGFLDFSCQMVNGHNAFE